MNKGIPVTISVIVAGALVLFAISPFGRIPLSVFLSVLQIRRIEHRMQQKSVYVPVANTLALYCQSDSNLFPNTMGYMWFPKEVQEMGGEDGMVSSNAAFLIFGGGFYHYGYVLTLNEQRSDAITNVWDLLLRREGSADLHLYTLSIPKTNALSADSLPQQVLAGYDERIKHDPTDLQAYQGRIRLLLRFGKIADARASCKTMLGKLTDEDAWWSYLVNALVMDEERSAGAGEAFLLDWVRQQPSFFSYLDLAYYYQLQKQPKQAVAAMLKAMDYNDCNGPTGHGCNAECRGYTAAMYAHQCGEDAVVVKLCDKLLGVTINGDYAKPGLRTLKSAAEKSQQGERVQVSWDERILPFDAFQDFDIEKLLGRPVDRPHRDTGQFHPGL
ncbi:MAG TPA: hypothetical protein VMV72_05520 [Verrucomicrobiae bacterium]|nr:hypothetical protein [Verrucomicrobiae bacterium]